MAHPVKIVDLVSDKDFDRFDIVRKNEVVDGMWGMSHIRITDEDIKSLKEGKCLYHKDGEYAQVISYESEGI